MDEKKVRARVSYQNFERMAKVADSGDVKLILEELHNIFNEKRLYGSVKGAEYAQESLELIIKDLNLQS